VRLVATQTDRVISPFADGINEMRNRRNQSKRKSGNAALDQFAIRSGALERLREKYPSQIDKMLGLVVKANKEVKSRLPTLGFELDGIIYQHGRRQRSSYLKAQKQRRMSLQSARELLKSVTTDLGSLDKDHIQVFYYHLCKENPEFSRTNWLQFMAIVKVSTEVLDLVTEVYSSTFAEPPKKRGRKPLPYGEATADLIDLWERWTNKPVPISKIHGDGIPNDPGHFVNLGMTLIDPKITSSKVVTSINTVLGRRKTTTQQSADFDRSH
jgi:hypothetical protein